MDGLPSLLVEAARSAAREDGVAEPKQKYDEPKNPDDALANGIGDNRSNIKEDNGQAGSNADALNKPREDLEDEDVSSEPVPPLRRGKWTPEEEAYASRLIVEFKAGLLPLTDGTTLRTFLSKLLNCDPMRISKKFVGSNCIGKQVFRRRSADVSNLTPEQIRRTRKDLSELEKRFLDRVTKGGSRKGEKHSRNTSTTPPGDRAEKKIKLSEDQSAPASMVGGLGGGLAASTVMGNMNKSAAAAGHAMLQGGSGANGVDGGAGNAGLLAQLQESQPGMFNVNDTRLFNSFMAPGNVGLNLPGMAPGAALGNMNPTLDMNALMLQTGMTPEQISQLAHNQGLSSASLSQMLGKNRSFDRLMSLDFQSMQSIDNLANLIQHGMPNQSHVKPMKNWDWNNNGMQNPQGGIGLGNTGLENLSASMLGFNRAHNASHGFGTEPNSAFGNLLGNYNQSSLLQNLQPQQQHQLSQLQSFMNPNANSQDQRFENFLQGMGGAPAGGNSYNALLQSVQNGSNNGGNDFSALMGPPSRNLPPQNLMGLNSSFGGNPFGGLPQAGGNSMMAAIAAQQQMLNQSKVGGGNAGMNGLLSQQNQLAGLGRGGLGGMDLTGFNLSDPTTSAFLQHLLAKQGGGAGQLAAGLTGLGSTTHPQVGNGTAGGLPQANSNFDNSTSDGGKSDTGQSAVV